MIPGTGPGRGVPWWRGLTGWLLLLKPGLLGREPAGQPREGRTVTRFERKDEW